MTHRKVRSLATPRIPADVRNGSKRALAARLCYRSGRFDLIADRAHAAELPKPRRYALQHQANDAHPATVKVPWNKGKVIGAKPPLQTKHVWSIRTKLQMDGKKRDLAMFNLAIDSKLRGCDVVHIKVEDVAPRGLTADRACVRQRKTGHPVKFELTIPRT